MKYYAVCEIGNKEIELERTIMEAEEFAGIDYLCECGDK